MSQGADPLRMMYVGILTTLLLLTGCFGLVEDDVIDSTSGEVTDQQFSDLENRVFDVETLAASHTTDIADLDARVTLIESNMLTIADVMAALPPGVDLSDYLTSADIASLVSDAQTAQTAIQMSAADIAALEQDVADLEADLQALQNANPGAGGSSYPPIIKNFELFIQDTYYYDDGNLAGLGAVYPDALNQQTGVYVQCSIYDVEGDDLDTVGLDIDHDGIADYSINTIYVETSGSYICDSSDTFIDNGDFTYNDDFSDPRIELIGALGVEDDTGAWTWDANWVTSWDITTYESWMIYVNGINFEVQDHPDSILWGTENNYDHLFEFGYSCDFYDDAGNPTGMTGALCQDIVPVTFGDVPDYPSYLTQNEYRIKLSVSTTDGGYCTPDGLSHTGYYDDCFVSAGLGFPNAQNVYDMTEGGISMAGITISENWDGHYTNRMCAADGYNSNTPACTATVSIYFQQFNDDHSGMANPYQTLFTETITLDLY